MQIMTLKTTTRGKLGIEVV